MKLFTIASLVVVTFAAGAAAARAEFGWTRISAPCVPTAVAMTGDDLAVTCPGDRTVYVKSR